MRKIGFIFLIFCNFTFLSAQYTTELGSMEEIDGMDGDLEYVLLHSQRKKKITVKVYPADSTEFYNRNVPCVFTFKFLNDSVVREKHYHYVSYSLIRDNELFSYDNKRKRIKLSNGGSVKDSLDYKIWHYISLNRKDTSHFFLREKYDSIGRIIERTSSIANYTHFVIYKYQKDSLVLIEHKTFDRGIFKLTSSFTPMISKREGNCELFSSIGLSYDVTGKEVVSTNVVSVKRCLIFDSKNRIISLEKFESFSKNDPWVYRGKMIIGYKG